MFVINRCNVLSALRLLITKLLLLALVYSTAVQAATQAALQADNSAVILMYHNVAYDTPASTSVTPEVFKQHMQYIADNDYTVWPLFKTLVHLATAKPIPEKTVVLTFDDAYKSVYSEAFPVLKDKGWPFTVFVTTNYIADGYNNFMSWQQLREMQAFGASVGNHSLSHPHLVRQSSTESDKQWSERIFNEIHQAQTVLQQQVEQPVWVVAYPYGEYNAYIKTLLREMGYFALGQHSGAASYTSDFQALPRFPMATGFDGMEDFAIKVSSKNLPLTVLSPDNGFVSKDTDIPVLRMRLDEANYRKEALACYASGQGRIQHHWINRERGELTVKANQAIKPGRTKYNCTAPSKTEAGVYYWFSYLWMKPEADGRWYSE